MAGFRDMDGDALDGHYLGIRTCLFCDFAYDRINRVRVPAARRAELCEVCNKHPVGNWRPVFLVSGRTHFYPMLRRDIRVSVGRQAIARSRMAVRLDNIPREVVDELSCVGMMALPAEQGIFGGRMVAKPGRWKYMYKFKTTKTGTVRGWCFTSFASIGAILSFHEVDDGLKGNSFKNVVRTPCGDLVVAIPPMHITHRERLCGPDGGILNSMEVRFPTMLISDCENSKPNFASIQGDRFASHLEWPLRPEYTSYETYCASSLKVLLQSTDAARLRVSKKIKDSLAGWPDPLEVEYDPRITRDAHVDHPKLRKSITGFAGH